MTDKETAHTSSTGSAGDIVTCAWCGTQAEGGPPLTWTASLEGFGAAATMRYYCPDCSRENARAIEGRLDAAWW